MECLLSFLFPLLLTFLLFLYMLGKYKKNSSKARKCPPGPWKLPLLGNLHQLVTQRARPLHCTLSDLAHRHGHIMHLQLGEIFSVVISSPEAAKEVLKTQDLIFADRPRLLFSQMFSSNFINVASSPYGDYWRQLRKICTLELLSAKRVRSYKSVREEEVINLIKSILRSPGVPINLTEKIFSMTNDVTSRAAFGNKCKEKDVFISSVKAAVKLGTEFYVPDVLPSFKFLHRISQANIRILERLKTRGDKILDNIIDDHVAKRKNSMTGIEKVGDEQEDLINVLLRLQESSRLGFSIGRDNIKAIILDLFTAGTETSASTIEWAMSELIKNPRIMKKVQAEVRSVTRGTGDIIEETDIQQMNYLKLVIKETLRLHPPIPLSLPREARESTKVGPYYIPMKTMVIINLWAIGRSQVYWTNPNCFEPERFDGSKIDFKGKDFEYIPFGAGRRICPGILFGITNVELSLAHLLYHFDWKLPDGIKIEEFDMTEDSGATLQRKNALKLIGIPHTPWSVCNTNLSSATFCIHIGIFVLE